MNAPNDPKRTYALVVSVEKYVDSSAPNLNGPLRDGIEFMNWLLKQGVVPDNIRWLASGLEENSSALEEFAATSKVRHRGQATEASFAEVIHSFEKEPIDGDSFFFSGLVTV